MGFIYDSLKINLFPLSARQRNVCFLLLLVWFLNSVWDFITHRVHSDKLYLRIKALFVKRQDLILIQISQVIWISNQLGYITSPYSSYGTYLEFTQTA